MYQIAEGSTGGLKDVERFLEFLNHPESHPVLRTEGFPDSSAPLYVTRAPGRLDLMGGIADYSGSLVLQLPIREATMVALQRRPEPHVQIVSLGDESGRHLRVFHMPLSHFERNGPAENYELAKAYFRQDPATSWAAYAAGVFLVLMKEGHTCFGEGARILITSDVPEGKGVSSSAAIEVAVMQAVATAYGLKIGPSETALLCQKVENLVVGAPCGVMDQMTAVYGQTGRLMTLLCQPAELETPVDLPADVEVWGLDSGVRHSVSGADYGSVRAGAFMGYRIIADRVGMPVRPDGNRDGLVHISDSRWHGYLANVTPSFFQQHFVDKLPEKVRGQDFLSRYQGTTDAVTRVEPDRDYAVRMPTAHPIHEHFRVRCFRELLRNAVSEERLTLLGELMYQSHASYSACGLGCEETDLLVQSVRRMGPSKGLFGAKITGGGSGGTVAILGRPGSAEAVLTVAEAYERQSGRHPHLFYGSSPGTAAFGCIKLVPR
ncbi:MAG: galactokinase family protein [Phycisphaerae bacterium]|nr:galactokinase family protein [Phycisphaerae bacterium]